MGRSAEADGRSQKHGLTWERFTRLLATFPLRHRTLLIPDSGYLQEEPGAGKLHARICEGESRMAELLH